MNAKVMTTLCSIMFAAGTVQASVITGDTYTKVETAEMQLCPDVNGTAGTDQDDEIKALEKRVSELEHQLEFVSLKGEIHELISDLNTFKLTLTTSCNEIKLFIVTRNFDIVLKDAYKAFQDSNENLYQTYKERTESLRNLYKAKEQYYNFSNDEKLVLESYFDLVEKGFNAIDANRNLFNKTLELYEKLL